MIFRVDHHVLGPEIAMDDSVIVDVGERLADAERDFDGALLRKFFLFVQDLAQQLAVDPFHHHVVLGGMFLGEDLENVRVIEMAADFGGALEALGEDEIGIHVRVRNLQRDGFVVAQIGGAIHGIDIARRDDAIDAVVIQLFAGLNLRAPT